MSFRCGLCNSVVPNKVSPFTIVTKIREKDYFKKDKLIGRGWEIVEEKKICGFCKASIEKDGDTNV